MKIRLVTPAAPGSLAGNRVTATRWERLLRASEHQVAVEEAYSGGAADMMVALHARRSHASIIRFRFEHPDAPVILALTGTDLYADVEHSKEAQESLEVADRLVVLQQAALDDLPGWAREKARVILQSAEPPPDPAPPDPRHFDLCVVGHLREVKDPFRAAEAARLLPADSRIRVLHLGAALSGDMAERARREERENPRYHWLGAKPREQSLRVMSGCRALVLTSRLEGGANVVSEAIVAGVPVISTRIPGSIGLLGEEYPGYFPVGDTQALADLLLRAERNTGYYAELKEWCAGLAPRFAPEREWESWVRLLAELEH